MPALKEQTTMGKEGQRACPITACAFVYLFHSKPATKAKKCWLDWWEDARRGRVCPIKCGLLRAKGQPLESVNVVTVGTDQSHASAILIRHGRARGKTHSDREFLVARSHTKQHSFARMKPFALSAQHTLSKCSWRGNTHTLLQAWLICETLCDFSGAELVVESCFLRVNTTSEDKKLCY